jgi:cytosine/uracil/thiamine/allantoin permease
MQEILKVMLPAWFLNEKSLNEKVKLSAKKNKLLTFYFFYGISINCLFMQRHKKNSLTQKYYGFHSKTNEEMR